MYRIPSSLCALLVVMATGVGSADAQQNDGKNWNLSGSFGLQYDDNVTVDQTDNSTNLSDEAAVIELSGLYRPAFGREVGLELGYDFSQSLYNEQTNFNLQSHNLSAYVERQFGETDASLNYIYARTLLGGHDFLSLHSLTPSLGRSLTDRWYANLRYAYYNKDFIRDVDDRRDANTHSVTFDNFLFFMSGKAHVSLGYRIESENTRGPEFDYLGHFFHIRLKSPIPADRLSRWNPRGELGFEYGIKDFDNVTPSIGTRRDDDRSTVTLNLIADLTDHAVIRLEYRYIDANSNLASADYTENIVTLKVGLNY